MTLSFNQLTTYITSIVSFRTHASSISFTFSLQLLASLHLPTNSKSQESNSLSSLTNPTRLSDIGLTMDYVANETTLSSNGLNLQDFPKEILFIITEYLFEDVVFHPDPKKPPLWSRVLLRRKPIWKFFWGSPDTYPLELVTQFDLGGGRAGPISLLMTSRRLYPVAKESLYREATLAFCESYPEFRKEKHNAPLRLSQNPPNICSKFQKLCWRRPSRHFRDTDRILDGNPNEARYVNPPIQLRSIMPSIANLLPIPFITLLSPCRATFCGLCLRHASY